MAQIRTKREGARRFPVLSIIIAIVLGVGCDSSGPPNESTLERIRRDGVIRVGYANEAPFAYVDESGHLTGEAPEIAWVVFQEMGIEKVERVLTEFGALIPGLKAKRFDLIAAGMYILPKRCREIRFSRPTYKIGEAFLVAAGNPLHLYSYEDAAIRTAVRLGVVAGAVQRGYAQASGIPDQRIIVLPDAPSAVAALQAGRIDAFAGTALTVRDLLNKVKDRSIERAMPFQNPVIRGRIVEGYGAFGVRRDDQELIEAVNQRLETLIGSKQHRDLVRPFGFSSAELPGAVQTESLCTQ